METGSGSAWPLVGRDDEVRQALASIDDASEFQGGRVGGRQRDRQIDAGSHPRECQVARTYVPQFVLAGHRKPAQLDTCKSEAGEEEPSVVWPANRTPWNSEASWITPGGTHTAARRRPRRPTSRGRRTSNLPEHGFTQTLPQLRPGSRQMLKTSEKIFNQTLI